ncbi:hypothetical protein IQ244_27230 [Nostoc sp. LEGE 06077]|nr:hypothetical protein [Nostoc sp. LEGE 06077]
MSVLTYSYLIVEVYGCAIAIFLKGECDHHSNPIKINYAIALSTGVCSSAAGFTRLRN